MPGCCSWLSDAEQSARPFSPGLFAGSTATAFITTFVYWWVDAGWRKSEEPAGALPMAPRLPATKTERPLLNFTRTAPITLSGGGNCAARGPRQFARRDATSRAATGALHDEGVCQPSPIPRSPRPGWPGSGCTSSRPYRWMKYHYQRGPPRRARRAGSWRRHRHGRHAYALRT